VKPNTRVQPQRIKTETAKWAKIVKEAGIKAE